MRTLSLSILFARLTVATRSESPWDSNPESPSTSFEVSCCCRSKNLSFCPLTFADLTMTASSIFTIGVNPDVGLDGDEAIPSLHRLLLSLVQCVARSWDWKYFLRCSFSSASKASSFSRSTIRRVGTDARSVDHHVGQPLGQVVVLPVARVVVEVEHHHRGSRGLRRPRATGNERGGERDERREPGAVFAGICEGERREGRIGGRYRQPLANARRSRLGSAGSAAAKLDNVRPRRMIRP